MANKEQLIYQEYKAQPKKRLDHVIFDVDSCLVAIEGIDELARMRNVYDQVAGLTRSAMNGEIGFDEVFAKRLDIINPRRNDLTEVGRQYVQNITAFAPQIIALLREAGTDVWLVSGGFDEAIYPLAAALGIDGDHVFANHLYFDEQGAYLNYDRDNPLAGNQGKRAVIAALKKEGKLDGKVAIIGDGMAEMETHDIVDVRIGYGGHVLRENVRANADVYVDDPSLFPLASILI